MQHSSCTCACFFVLDNATMKLIHKDKTSESTCITRLFGKKKKTRVSYQNFGLYLVEATSLLLSRKKHMDILGKMGVMLVSARKSIGELDNEQV